MNQIVYWSQLLDWKNQTLTPNPNSIYLMPFFDTATAGPIVVEIPPAEGGSITGTLMDCWQTAFEDVGPAGVDKGAGGKYLILPPGYDQPVPDGYFAFPSDVYQGYGLLRSILKGGDDAIAKAVDYGKRIKLYPLSQADNPPATTFVDAAGQMFDATIPYDVRFFESLDRMVQSQPWIARDRLAINMLRSLGIEKGKPFAPECGDEGHPGAATAGSPLLLRPILRELPALRWASADVLIEDCIFIVSRDQPEDRWLLQRNQTSSWSWPMTSASGTSVPTTAA